MEIEAVDAYPEKVFDRAARRALKKWRFQAGEELVQNLRLVQTFDFILEDTSRQTFAFQRRCQAMTGQRICKPHWRNMDVVYVNRPHWMDQADKEALP